MGNSDPVSRSGWKSAAAGAIGGLVASFAMNQFQAAISAVSESAARQENRRKGQPEPRTKASSGGEDATVKAARAIATNVFHHELTDDEKTWGGPAVHYGLGTALGAVYGTLAPCVPIQGGGGAVYGTAVWLGADEIGVPVLGLSGPPWKTPISGHVEALASHLVFGWVTHVVRLLVLS